jgi:hypothetical protein
VNHSLNTVNTGDHLLLIIIPAVWLALGAFFVLVCVGAARADTLIRADTLMSATPTPTPAPAPAPARNGSPAMRRGVLVMLEDHRRHAATTRRSPARL